MSKTTKPLTDELVILGLECHLPGAEDVRAFEKLLVSGKTAYEELPEDRVQADRHFDERMGQPGKTYTTLGGLVAEKPFDLNFMRLKDTDLGTYDPVHLRFCETALRAWRNSGLNEQDSLLKQAGVYVGHSGATRYAGDVSMATMVVEGLEILRQLPAFQSLDQNSQQAVIDQVSSDIRSKRRTRSPSQPRLYDGYIAASLAAGQLGLQGPKIVVDAACASSLYALQQAALAIWAGRIPAAIVGGATSNSVDNLILFSQSQACSPKGSYPFDQQASGLVSSEGYAAIVVTTRSLAEKLGRPVLAVIEGIGTASDGRGKSLWAPRQEGQVLAISRAYPPSSPLEIDYLEGHATGTQLGDATELESVSQLRTNRNGPLLMGSVKSNLGHTLETAGMVGLTKIILAMTSGTIPPTVNVRQLTDRFEWSKKTVEIVRTPTPWPKKTSSTKDVAKRGAVSAFGIGGLNAHVTIRQGTASDPRSNFPERKAFEPIAIVGRGLVLPGALNIQEFSKALSTDASFIRPMPEHRWRGQAGISSGANHQPHHVPHNKAGWIENYRFESRDFRIPPKQISQSNPIQMMLLDAVRQALSEMGVQDLPSVSKIIDTVTTGVVVGTVFGGEFSNQLQFGLRLPEVCERLFVSLVAKGFDSRSAEQICQQFRDAYLKDRPALLDETGSFTASTLSSRIAKSFDCMGGAYSIDADDPSDLAALTLAVDYLQAGLWSTAIVGTAQRSLDLASFEQLDANGRLVRSGDISEVLKDNQSILPGEGVVVFVLQKLSEAKRRGLKVFGVLGVPPDTQQRLSQQDDAGRGLARKFGYLVGSQQFVRLAAETSKWEKQGSWRDQITSADVNLVATAHDKTTYCLTCTDPHQFERRPAQTAKPSPMSAPASKPLMIQPVTTPAKKHVKGAVFPLRLSSTTLDGLTQSLRAVVEAGRQAGLETDSSYAGLNWRCSITAASDDELKSRAGRLLQEIGRGKTGGVFESIQAILWNKTSADSIRIGWVYPGQGSYYDQPLGFLDQPIAEQIIGRIDRACQSIGAKAIGPVLRGAEEYRPQDVWMNQLWVLASSLISSSLLKQAGLAPHAVLGHSFGDYAALTAHGAITIEQAVQLVKWRTDAVTMRVTQRGKLVSVRGTLAEVQRAIAEANLPCLITHQNAPSQTVIAVSSDDAERVVGALMDRRLASLSLSIPVPYHTPWLSDAQSYLAQVMKGTNLRPISSAFLSTTSLKYLSEPEDLKGNLLAQLTSPVLYQPAVERMMRDGCDVLIEVGPNNVLSRMNHEISGGNALCVSADLPGESFSSRLEFIQEVLTIAGSEVTVATARPVSVTASSTLKPQAQVQPKSTSNVEVIDLRRGAVRAAKIEPLASERLPHSNGVSAKPPSAPRVEIEAEVVRSVRNDEPSDEPTVTADAAQIEMYLKTLLVELTGYEPSVIDLDADLEADLGVDSIKKAQVIGEAVECYGITVNATSMRLDQFKTLADIKALIVEHSQIDEPAPAVTPVTSAATVHEPVAVPESSIVESDASVASATSPQAIADFLITLVVDQTGYERDLVDLDAELEADLGIDSIKQAQILGEVQQHYEISSFRAERSTLSQFKTLRSIQQFLLNQMSGEEMGGERETAVEKTHTSMPVSVAKPETNGHSGKTNGSIFDVYVNGHSDDQIGRIAYEHGFRNREQIQKSLRNMLQRGDLASAANGHTEEVSIEVNSLARGAGVPAESIQLARRFLQRSQNETSLEKKKAELTAEKSSAPFTSAPLLPDDAMRLVMRTVKAPHRAGMPTEPTFNGPALVLGDNAIARELMTRLKSRGVNAHQLHSVQSRDELEARLDGIWARESTPHIFITSPWDPASFRDFALNAWKQRRFEALEVPYRTCQRWMTSQLKAGTFGQSSLILVTNGGGDFGFSGKSMVSPESGLSGLMKAIVIESWMQGERSTPVKTIDVSPETTALDAVTAIFQELAAPSYEPEIAICGKERSTAQAFHRPLNNENQSRSTPKITPGSHWVVTGGARGITTVVAQEIAQKYGIVLHLVGKSPAPALTESIRSRAVENRAALKRQVIFEANSRGQNGIETWRNLEKAIEIDQSLARFADIGIKAFYHSADVSDVSEMSQVLNTIRHQHGAIEGVLHGAGIGQDARFDLKRPDKVDQCLKAKIDGCINLMSLTMKDPLKWIITFGSISGRFGANGHTDYSLANESMAKLVDRYRTVRPEVASVNFHWHAWGDIGMATKPETKLALEMIDIEFMPARIGLMHLMNELAYGGDEPEVLITDRKYYRKFFHRDRAQTTAVNALPLLDPDGTRQTADEVMSLSLDPKNERFLSQHRVQGTATLPFVVAMELMAEAVRAKTNQDVVELKDVAAVQAVKFPADLPRTVSFKVQQQGDASYCELTADVIRRDGQVVSRDKTFFRGSYVTGQTSAQTSRFEVPNAREIQNWQDVVYHDDPNGAIFHGDSLRCLRRISIDGDELIGEISANSPSHLSGENRPTVNWTIAPSVVDACLYAAAMLAGRRFEKLSLPSRFDRILIGRLPDPGEICYVTCRVTGETSSGAVMTVILTGQNGDMLWLAEGYHLAWLGQGESIALASSKM
ncbi:SDR family NAD(P)-dependent oxidoreductase [Lacunimicrobium album]